MRHGTGLVVALSIAFGATGAARADVQEDPFAATAGTERSTAPEVDAAKAADIRKLLEVMGSARNTMQVLPQMMQALRKLSPDVPDSVWQEFMAEVKPEELIELIVPIYDRHLSHEDVKALIRFYSSPIGQRLVQQLPAISSESLAAGQQWGAKIAQRVMQRLQQREAADKAQ